uniref:Alpha/beta-Hydrolases superfamily protein n=1 Tax=Steinernema glaseri TaxID=37863 RepID=A0A1I8A0Y1_9BILA
MQQSNTYVSGVGGMHIYMYLTSKTTPEVQATIVEISYIPLLKPPQQEEAPFMSCLPSKVSLCGEVITPRNCKSLVDDIF